jgi:putative phosphoesterase
MKIAVLADVHGNYIALERCLEYTIAQDISTYIFLGDYIGELAYPERTMKLLYDIKDMYQCYFIKGNKEDYWLNYRANGENGWKDRDSTTGSLLYAYNSLSEKDMDFFAQLKISQEITIGEMEMITACHGSPFQSNEKLLPDNERTYDIMDRIESDIILCGHSHIQRKIVHNEKMVLNPGSVGVPLFSGGRTQFLILHGENGEWAEEFISLEYDVDRVIKDIQEAKLPEHAPYWSRITRNILRGGNVSHSKVLTRAMELCRENTGECVWPNIAEKYWEQAVNDLIRE